MELPGLPIKKTLALALFAALACFPGCLRNSGYPSRPVTIICPWAVGGGTDAVARLMAKLLQDEMGAPVSVVNRTGGGGVTGHTAGAKAPPDGYTVLMITVEIAMMHHRGLTDIGPEDFEPVKLINRDAAAVFVRTEAPWRTLAELEQFVREHPGRLRASGTALGGIWHLACTSALLAMGLEAEAIRWVPSEGSGPARQELLSGGVEVVFCSLSEGKAQMEAARIRSLGVMAERRLEIFPEIPTFKEQGVDWTLEGWRGLALPRGTPPEIVQRFEAFVAKAVSGAEFVEFMGRGGYDARVENSQEFARTFERDDRVLGELLRQSKILGGGRGDEPGPWFFPALLLGGLALAISSLILKRLARPAAAESRSPLAQAASRPAGAWLLFGEVLAAVLVYILLSEPLGFLLTAALLLLDLFRRLRTGWLASCLATLLLVPGAYLLFAKLMRVPLPSGLIPW
ncbi:MAG: tripartite tricarboxylate transporter substrate binding protein [Planctomycetes bacterium]|nr:tripartite tricarboxylate transporter substrate binding protein [Planctomycetota bacterium]